MIWSPGQWLTRYGMRAVVAQIQTKGGKWNIRGAICCPTSGALAISEWDYHGKIRTVSGIQTEDQDFDLTEERYEKENP